MTGHIHHKRIIVPEIGDVLLLFAQVFAHLINLTQFFFIRRSFYSAVRKWTGGLKLIAGVHHPAPNLVPLRLSSIHISRGRWYPGAFLVGNGVLETPRLLVGVFGRIIENVFGNRLAINHRAIINFIGDTVFFILLVERWFKFIVEISRERQGAGHGQKCPCRCQWKTIFLSGFGFWGNRKPFHFAP